MIIKHPFSFYPRSIFKEIPSGLVGELRLIITAAGLSVFVGCHTEFLFKKHVKLRKVFISNLRCNINDFILECDNKFLA